MKITPNHVAAACLAAMDAHNRAAPVRVLGVQPVLSDGRITGLVFTYHEHQVSSACVPIDDAPRQAAWFEFFKRIPFGSVVEEDV